MIFHMWKLKEKVLKSVNYLGPLNKLPHFRGVLQCSTKQESGGGRFEPIADQRSRYDSRGPMRSRPSFCGDNEGQSEPREMRRAQRLCIGAPHHRQDMSPWWSVQTVENAESLPLDLSVPAEHELRLSSTSVATQKSHFDGELLPLSWRNRPKL